MSERFETFLTPASWVDVKLDVILAMISEGEGLLVPFVPSAQTKDLLPSNWSTRECIGAGSPRPYFMKIKHCEVIGGRIETHIIQSVEENFSIGKKYSVGDGENQAAQDGQLHEISSNFEGQGKNILLTNRCLERTIQFFQMRAQNCLRNRFNMKFRQLYIGDI